MARGVNKLSARSLDRALKKPGLYGDGSGLFFKVRRGGSAQWVFITTRGGRRTEIGLGGFRFVPISEARKKAIRAREALDKGEDLKRIFKPVSATPTFGKCADDFLKSQSSIWSNPKHRSQWETSLSGTYDTARIRVDQAAHRSHVVALKKMRSMPVDAIDTKDVLAVLKPIWSLMPESASRLRGRIEAVLAYAKAHSYRTGENPATWRGHLDAILPARGKLTRGHQKALLYKNMPSFISELRSRESISRLCLEFLILTAARSGEVRNASWLEIDLEQKIWVVPAARMKARKEHRVPLSDPALKILNQMRELSTSNLVFPGAKPKAPLTDTAISKQAKEIGGDITVHGFRSAFRDWAGDQTEFPREVIETALAHTIKNKAEAAYRRSDAIEKRRNLMTAWAAFCSGESVENVFPLLKVI